jgi:hypothetical protein
MSDEWRSTLVPIFKNKGDIQSCINYRGIKLMSHTMKLWERVIDHRLRGMTHITMNQFGFMLGRSTMEAIFLIRQVMERYKEQKKDLHMVFIDLEKAYDKIPRNLIWWALDKHKVPTKLLRPIKPIYSLLPIYTLQYPRGSLSRLIKVSNMVTEQVRVYV